MPWFKISDDWLDHPKVQRAGKNGRALWVAVGNRAAKYSSDGLIEGDLIKSIAALAEVPAAATARKLVELELWHSHDTLKNCGKCRRDIEVINGHRREDGQELLRIGPGDYYFHDWAFHQLSKRRTLTVEARMAEDRDRALRKDPALCELIQARDKSLCRYCGNRLNWLARKGATYATYDHVDPFCFAPNNGNFLEGVVTACGSCNSEKGQRTPDEWAAAGGKTLKPAGWKAGDAEPDVDLPLIYPESDPDLIPTPSESDSGSSSPRVHGQPHAPLGPGRIGLGPGPGPGQIGLGGAGSGLAGLVRPERGRDGSAEGASRPSPATDPSDGSTTHATDATHELPPEGSADA